MHGIIAVHGFVNASYELTEGQALEIQIELHVKGDSSFHPISLNGSITLMAGGTGSEFHSVTYDSCTIMILC